ncbi:CHASE domain-containing protein [Magnetococcales bacterium HHB-1]
MALDFKKIPRTVILTLLFGSIISLSLYYAVADLSHRQIEAEFRRAVDERAASFRSELEVTFKTLYDIRGLFNASEEVSREEFKIFVEQTLIYRSGVQALEWAPRVLHTQRADYQQMVHQEGFSDFKITERRAKGEMVRAGVRDEYFPVYFVEPFEKNRAAFGFDMASNKIREETLNASFNQNKLLATAPITLVQETGVQKGIIVFLPVYNSSVDKEKRREDVLPKHREGLQGFILGVFRIGDLFNMALNRVSQKGVGIHMILEDRSEVEKVKQLYQYRPHVENQNYAALRYEKSLGEIAGRDWYIRAIATEHYLDRHYNPFPVMTLVGALLVSGLLAIHLYSNACHTLEVERLIHVRTTALYEQEMENKIIVEAAVTGLIKINSRGIIEAFNPAAEKMFLYKSKEVFGKNVKMIMPEPYHSQHDGYLRNYRKGDRAKIIGSIREVEGKRKDGSCFPLVLAVGEHEHEGRKKYVGFLLDITKQKEAERIKSEFVSTVSHELRTPLTSIKGTLGLVLGGVVGELPTKAEMLLKRAMDNTDRLTLLINDLLDMEKMQSGQIVFESSPIDIKKLLREVIIANEGYGEKFSVSIKLLEMPSEVLTIEGNEGRLMQVFSNLLSNAIKFSPKGGTVDIQVRCFEQEGNPWLRISVIDHGSGIPEAFHSRIFERFSQADASSTRQKGGTGLGLAISKTIVERLNGKINFESREGEGSHFFVEFPRI